MIISSSTKIISSTTATPIETTIKIIYRDIKNVLTDTKSYSNIHLVLTEMENEQFEIVANNNNLEIRANDELGFIYGLYEFSKTFLGINEFWFWNNQVITQKENISIPDNFYYKSNPFKVKLRGWFINDEVLIHKWTLDHSSTKPWEMAFEALLRLGGNMVIAGTGKNAHINRSLAATYGLAISHHHAEPLGAEMYLNAYPDLNPSYDEHPDKFLKLWENAIEDQKDCKVVWNLGFRGQGDCPFWSCDPKYDTSEKRGKLISQLMKIQYDLIRKYRPNDICCTNLYGEILELYRENCLNIPDDIIKIWGDNGFGKMVSRRQGNHNPRIPAIASPLDTGSQGIYYHASFYDLQAANHITMLPNSPKFIMNELSEILSNNMNSYWIVNSSNIKPHAFYLELISDVWKNGLSDSSDFITYYIKKYYGQENYELIVNTFNKYFESAVPFGNFEDEHAGEQFPNYTSRILTSQFLINKDLPSKSLNWALKSSTLKEQILWYKDLCTKGVNSYLDYLTECEKTSSHLKNQSKQLFIETLHLQGLIYYHSYVGGLHLCNGLLDAFDENYKQAFYNIGLARKSYLDANLAMRNSEKGKWSKFYENECLTDCKQTAWVLETLMGYIRNLGEGPHFYHWQKEYLYSIDEQKVMLITNLENHLNNLELFELMDTMYNN